jgi:hypothetical protein
MTTRTGVDHGGVHDHGTGQPVKSVLAHAVAQARALW